MYILGKIEEIGVRFKASGELLSSDKSFIESYYERILFKRFNNRGCGQCYNDAFIEMYTYVKRNGIKDMGKFILKREELIHIQGDKQVYARPNITDEIAIKYLSEYPNAIKKFETYPDNWEELTKSSEVKKDDIQVSIGTTIHQVETEQQLISNIAEMLINGVSKAKIKEDFKDIKTIGGKKLTTRYLGDLIKLAEDQIKAEANQN